MTRRSGEGDEDFRDQHPFAGDPAPLGRIDARGAGRRITRSHAAPFALLMRDRLDRRERDGGGDARVNEAPGRGEFALPQLHLRHPARDHRAVTAGHHHAIAGEDRGDGGGIGGFDRAVEGGAAGADGEFGHGWGYRMGGVWSAIGRLLGCMVGIVGDCYRASARAGC